MIRQSREDVSEPSLWVDVVELSGVDERVDGSGAMSALVRTCEGPVLAPDGGPAELPLGGIVGHAQTAVVQEARKRGPAGEAVGNSSAELALAREFGTSLA